MSSEFGKHTVLESPGFAIPTVICFRSQRSIGVIDELHIVIDEPMDQVIANFDDLEKLRLWMRITGFFMPGAFRIQTRKSLDASKAFAEKK